MNSEKEQVQFSRFRDFLRKFKKQKTAIAALLVIVLLGVIAVVGERIAPFGIDEFDYSSILQGPSSAHWFGTDEFGRDLFSRILCGTRISLLVGICAVTVGAKTGTAQRGEGLVNNAMFILYAPYEEPEIALSIAVEKGGAGATLSPVARQVVDYYFAFQANTNIVENNYSLLK